MSNSFVQEMASKSPPEAGNPDKGNTIDAVSNNYEFQDSLGLSTVVIDYKAERALRWKLDLTLLPLLVCMSVFTAFDKSNVGNAKTAGLEASLNMVNNQYNIMLSVYFIPYVLCAPIMAMLSKKIGPNNMLPLMGLVCGIMTLLVLTVHNFAGLLVLRLIMAAFDGGKFPVVIYYLTMFYRRGELARRLAFYYASVGIGGACSGLLSYSLFRITNTSLAPWRYLFLVEGLCTVVISTIGWFILPKSAATARFLSPAQRSLAFYRVQSDSSSEVNEQFSLKEAAKVFRHPTTWVFVLIDCCVGFPLQSVSLFLPQIIGRLGYNTLKTNLYTVGPQLTGVVVMLAISFASDYAKFRFPFVITGFAITFIGFIVYASIDVLNMLEVAYFACFLLTWGNLAPAVVLDVWYNNNVADENRRLLLTSVALSMGNAMGVVCSNIFRAQDAPKYLLALEVAAGFGGAGMLLTACLGLYMIVDNRKRDRKQGVKRKAREVPTQFLKEGPQCPEFRWFL